MSSICQSHKEKTDFSRLLLVEFDFGEWQSGFELSQFWLWYCAEMWTLNACVSEPLHSTVEIKLQIFSLLMAILNFETEMILNLEEVFLLSVAMSFSWHELTMLHLVLFCCTLMWSDVLTWISINYLIVTRNGDSRIGYTFSMFSTLTQELSSFSNITMHISQPWYFSVRSKQDYSKLPHPNTCASIYCKMITSCFLVFVLFPRSSWHN